MKEYKFKIGDLVYAKCKTYNKEMWHTFLSKAKNRKGEVVKITTDHVDVMIDSGGLYFFYPEDLIVVNCGTCGLIWSCFQETTCIKNFKNWIPNPYEWRIKIGVGGGDIMTAGKFKIGDLVYTKQKTSCPDSWSIFLEDSPNRRGVVNILRYDGYYADIETDIGSLFSFNCKDLIPINCGTCGEDYYCCPVCIKFNFKYWWPKKEDIILVGIKVKATDQIKEEEKMEYKKISTINAETLLKAKLCGVSVYKSYLDKFGFDDIDETTFSSFIEFAKYNTCIKFLIDKGFIKAGYILTNMKDEKKTFYNMGDIFYCKSKLKYYMLARLGLTEAALISIPYGHRWSPQKKVKWIPGIISGKISKADFDIVANNHAFKFTKVNDKTKVYMDLATELD